MKILGMGWPEFLIIVAVILIIFGPKQLPKLGKALGKTFKNLKKGISEDEEAAPVPAETTEVAIVSVETVAPAAAAAPAQAAPAAAPAAAADVTAPKTVKKTVVRKKVE